jgi:hypothetical protein
MARLKVSKYASLGEFLRSRRSQLVPLTFGEIERITGVKLPPKAQHHRAWWSNNPTNNVMTKIWLDAGFQTEQVDVARRRLVFRRVRQNAAAAAPQEGARHRELTTGAHPLRGLLKDVTRIPHGIDLTQPADPAWADELDRNGVSG